MGGKVKIKSAGSRTNWPSGLRRAAMAFALVQGFAAVTISLASDVQAVLWNGSKVTGAWLGSPAQGAIDLQTAKGPSSSALDELRTVTFPVGQRAPSGPMAFHLNDGGVVFGTLLGNESETVKAVTILGEMQIPWSRLAGIRLAEPTQFKRAQQLLEEALQSRSPSQDVLISRDNADVKVLQGRLEVLQRDGGSFVFANESRKFQLEKVYAIVFAAGAAQTRQGSTLCELADGSSFTGTFAAGEKDSVQLADTFAGALAIPVADIRRMKFRSDRIAFLGDLKPSAQRTEGVLHSSWAVRTDRNVLGDPISMAGLTYERGIGVHSKSELTYALNGEFEQFATTIGLDDSVRPLGDVVMKIVGDGNTLYEADSVTGVDSPRDILLDIKGVKSLTLVVDYGGGLDASDHANWADARLIRGPSSNQSKR